MIVGFVNDSGIYSVPSREANNVASNNASNGSSSSGPEGIPGWFVMVGIGRQENKSIDTPLD